jgi:hypothetical protein
LDEAGKCTPHEYFDKEEQVEQFAQCVEGDEGIPPGDFE